jgi:hypothetical protein
LHPSVRLGPDLENVAEHTQGKRPDETKSHRRHSELESACSGHKISEADRSNFEPVETEVRRYTSFGNVPERSARLKEALCGPTVSAPAARRFPEDVQPSGYSQNRHSLVVPLVAFQGASHAPGQTTHSSIAAANAFVGGQKTPDRSFRPEAPLYFQGRRSLRQSGTG